MKAFSASYLTKIIALGILIFIESFILSQLISDFVGTQNVLSVSVEYSAKFVILMLLISYTFALTLGGWRKWEQYVFIPVPVSLAVFLTTIRLQYIYPTLLSLLFLVLLILDVYQSNNLKKLLLKPNPKMIMRFSTKGILFLFSILGGLLFLISANQTPKINVGRELANIIEKPLQQVVSGSVTPELAPIALGFIDVKKLAENQLNDLIEPYKQFINPVMAVLTFALFQFYASIAYLMYMLTIDLVYFIAKKARFLKTETVQVTQEHLTF